MQFIPYRDLRNEPSAVREQLTSEGELVVTNGGKPFALLIDIPEKENVEELLLMVSRIRAQMAVRSIRKNAKTNNTSQMSEEEISGIIEKSRRGNLG